MQPRGRGQQQEEEQEENRAVVLPAYPAAWREWLYKEYPPDKYVHETTWFGVSIAALAAAAATVGVINIQIPAFIYMISIVPFLTGTGAAATFPVRVGFQVTGNSDWTSGQWAAQVYTGGDQRSAGLVQELAFPRQCPVGTQIGVTVNNALNAAAAVTTDVVLTGVSVRRITNEFRNAMMRRG